MAAPNDNQKETLNKQHETETLKGTIFSVSMVGGFIFLTYLLLYGIYMVRV